MKQSVMYRISISFINFVDHIDKNASNIQLTGFNPTETKIIKLRIRKAQKF